MCFINEKMNYSHAHHRVSLLLVFLLPPNWLVLVIIYLTFTDPIASLTPQLYPSAWKCLREAAFPERRLLSLQPPPLFPLRLATPITVVALSIEFLVVVLL